MTTSRNVRCLLKVGQWLCHALTGCPGLGLYAEVGGGGLGRAKKIFSGKGLKITVVANDEIGLRGRCWGGGYVFCHVW